MNEKKFTYSQEAYKANTWWWWVTRLLAGAVGLILLTAAFLKAGDMELFSRQIRDYGIIHNYVLSVFMAWGLIILESGLGVALLVSYRQRLTLLSTMLLLLIFLGATVWVWLTGETEDCGCFGAWMRRTPGEAALDDLILFFAICMVWFGQRGTNLPQPSAKAWAIVTACLTGLVLPLVFGFPITRLDLVQSQGVGLEIGHIDIQGLDNSDLNRGAYLIILMDTACSHCHEVVPEINMLAETPDLPPVIALSTNEEFQRTTFIEEYQTVFPIGQIEEKVFWRLLADREMPSVIFVSDGRMRHVWDHTIPDKDEIKALYPSSSPGDSHSAKSKGK